MSDGANYTGMNDEPRCHNKYGGRLVTLGALVGVVVVVVVAYEIIKTTQLAAGDDQYTNTTHNSTASNTTNANSGLLIRLYDAAVDMGEPVTTKLSNAVSGLWGMLSGSTTEPPEATSGAELN